MSSYFDKFDREVRQLAQDTRGSDEQFLLQLKQLEATMIKTCELFAGDIDTPDDIRQAVIACIALNQVRYEGGDFLGDSTGPSQGAQHAMCCKSSQLSHEMHSLFHDIARRRIETRYGLVMDNPEHAVRMRDQWVEEHYEASEKAHYE